VRLVARSATVVDVADFEQVAAPLASPAGSLSVVDFGADPTGAKDSGTGVPNGVRGRRSPQHKVVWIPSGTFTVNRHLQVDGVTVQGAGPLVQRPPRQRSRDLRARGTDPERERPPGRLRDLR